MHESTEYTLRVYTLGVLVLLSPLWESIGPSPILDYPFFTGALSPCSPPFLDYYSCFPWIVTGFDQSVLVNADLAHRPKIHMLQVWESGLRSWVWSMRLLHHPGQVFPFMGLSFLSLLDKGSSSLFSQD